MPKFVLQRDNTAIGNNTFTGTTTHSGSLVASGGVVGNVTGNLTGNVVGSSTGAKTSEVVTATNVIAASESGTTFYLNTAGGFTSTLPAPALGLVFKFVVKTAPTTSYVITTNAGADVLYGMMEERAGTAGVAGAARDTFNFVANQSKIADWVVFESDGTNWYYFGMVDVAAGNTVAQS